MKFWGYLFLAAIVLWSFSSQAALVTMESPYSVKRTMDRLQKAVKSKKLKVFSRINHAVGAKKAGLKLADSEVLIFGNPKVGTQFMQALPTIALDLPMKMVVYKDKKGIVWIGYRDMHAVAAAHEGQVEKSLVNKVNGVLEGLARAAVKNGIKTRN
ncbi:MAG: hypothetical protein CL675_05490 [Bdellovibrionaceae bacterium]|nr:hypothetical protein [Pseudobdellovibrionaceae bacterium]